MNYLHDVKILCYYKISLTDLFVFIYFVVCMFFISTYNICIP